jgi:hypothetical protein
VSRSISYAPYSYRARVTLHAPLETVTARMPSGVGVLEAIDSKTCALLTGAESAEMLAVYLSLIGVDFEVREPPELVERIRMLAERYRRAAP